MATSADLIKATSLCLWGAVKSCAGAAGLIQMALSPLSLFLFFFFLFFNKYELEINVFKQIGNVFFIMSRIILR